MIACVSPCVSDREETLSTLFYASRASRIRNRPTRRTAPGAVPAEAASDRAEMLREIQLLRSEVASLKLQLPNETVAPDVGLPSNSSPPDDRRSLSTPLATETAALERRVQQVDQVNARLHAALDSAVAENNGLRRTLAMLRQERCSASGGILAAKNAAASAGGVELEETAGVVECATMESRLMELREDFDDLSQENWELLQENERTVSELTLIRQERDALEAAYIEMGKHCETLQGKLENLERVFTVGTPVSANDSDTTPAELAERWGLGSRDLTSE